MTINAERLFIDDQVYSLVDGLEVVSSENNIRSLLHQFAKQTGFKKFAFAEFKSGDARIVSDYPDGWLHRYLEQRYFAFDPVVVDGKRTLMPFAWDADDMIRAGGDIKLIAQEAEEYGIRSGFSMPIRIGFGGIAMLTVASDRSPGRSVAIRDPSLGSVAVAFVHVGLSRSNNVNFAARSDALSPREASCLGWASMGKTKAETAAMIGLSEKTVRFYLDRSMTKLRASNIAHAVRLAVQRHLI